MSINCRCCPNRFECEHLEWNGENYVPVAARKQREEESRPRHYDNQGYCDNPGRGY